MGSAGDVVEISSDEEDFPMTRKPPPVDWVDELFCEDDDYKSNGEDFLDLMVMGELSAPPVPPQKKGKSGGCDGGEDDDDCVVLDGDPDKAVSVMEGKGIAGDSSSDELQIVAEKGPVACRDFPHSRHLCSNWPFSTTSHVKHCSMCHCFVCDAPAPCSYWGKGTLINDHCHATDKEERWKTLRQAFKCKSIPASRPVKHQNALYPTIISPKQQDVHSPVSVPQSHMALKTNISHPCLANRSPLPNVVSQNQQRHTSVRVSLNIEQTVSSPRASPATKGGRSTGNVHTTHITHSHARFKRVGAASQDLTTRNDNQFGSTAPISAPSLMHKAVSKVSQPYAAAARTNAFTGTVQSNAPQRSLSAPIAFQGQQGQPVPSCQVMSNGVYDVGPQLSRCTSLMTQRTQFLPDPVLDVSTQSWQDILSSVASDLGVLDDSDYSTNTEQSQQPVMTSSKPLHSSANQGVGPHAESIVSTANMMTYNGCDLPSHPTGGTTQANAPSQTTQTLHPLNYNGCDLPSHSTDGTAQANAPSQTAQSLHPLTYNGCDLPSHLTGGTAQANAASQTTQTLHPLNYQSNLSPNEAHPDSYVSSPGDGLLVEAAHQRESSGLDSTGLIFDFELENWD